MSIQSKCYAAVLKSDLEVRKDLLQNIILSGGSTMFTGFRDRMENELTKLVTAVDFKVDVEAPKERVYTEW